MFKLRCEIALASDAPTCNSGVPGGGMISLLALLRDGQAIETATIGGEGWSARCPASAHEVG